MNCKRNPAIHKQGFTLMELLIYMGIVGIVVVIAGQAFSNSTNFRIRTDNMIRATQEAENVGVLLKDDLAQMGAKSSLENTIAGGNDEFSTAHIMDVYMDPNNAIPEKKDSSSYRFSPEYPSPTGNLDSLIFRRIRYSESGTYEAVEEVAWFLQRVGRDTVLKRQCVILDKASASVPDAPCASMGSKGSALTASAVVMATGIKTFRVLPALPLVRSDAAAKYSTEQIFPPGDGDVFKLVPRYGESNYHYITTSGGGTSVTLTDFVSNYDMTEEQIDVDGLKRQQVIVAQNENLETDSWLGACAADGNNFTFVPNELYEISFNVPYSGKEDNMQMFVPGRDHMSVGFVDYNGHSPAQIQDFLFYPAATDDASAVKRIMRFGVADSLKKVCMAFTFATYSPLASKGSLTISNLRLKRVANANYQFDKNITNVAVEDRKNVKAFQLHLEVKRGAKGNGSGETGSVMIVVPVPSNGPRG